MSCTKQIYYPVVRIYSGTPFPCFVMVYLACGTILEYISEPFQYIVSERGSTVEELRYGRKSFKYCSSTIFFKKTR